MPLLRRINVAIFIIGALFLLRGQLSMLWAQWDEYDGEYRNESGRAQASGRPIGVANAYTSPDGDQAVPGDKVVVMGKMQHEDTDWVAKYLPDWQHAIYTVDNTSAVLHTPINKGHEAMAYLTYLVEHYDHLPSTMAFIHSHWKGYRQAWHTDALHHSNVQSLRTLNIPFVQNNGYANLRCITETGCTKWCILPTCTDMIQPFRTDPKAHRGVDMVMADVWRYMFGDQVDVPAEIGTPCCAQFAVSKEQVQKRTKADYERFRQWIFDTDLPDDASGRVFEYLWHVIFGREAIYCPDEAQCYRDVYSIVAGAEGFLQQ